MMSMQKKKEVPKTCGLIDMIFSWSLGDVQNWNLYKYKVNDIPETFLSTEHYFRSFVTPLLEETRADLHSSMGTLYSAPMCRILELKQSKEFKYPKDLFYSISDKRHCSQETEATRIESNQKSAAKYELQVGDLFALTDVKPRCIADLNRRRRPYTIAVVLKDESSNIQIISSKPISFCKENKLLGVRGDTLFAVCLTNLTTNIRIWNALHPDRVCGNFNIIREVLQGNPIDEQTCSICSTDPKCKAVLSKSQKLISCFELDHSQEDAILSCIAARECHHRNTAKLIWGPPGTGKTKTVASLLFILLGLKCRTLTCAPTNIAVVGVAKQLMSLVIPTLKYGSYGLGDIVVFGNEGRMKIDDHEDLHDVFLDYRVSELASCVSSPSGYISSLEFMISLLEKPKEQYRLYVEISKDESGNSSDRNNESEDDEEYEGCGQKNKRTQKQRTPGSILAHTLKENERNNKGLVATKEEKKETTDSDSNNDIMTFTEFVRKRFHELSKPLTSCITILYTHLPTSFIRVEMVENMIKIIQILSGLGMVLDDVLDSETGLEIGMLSKRAEAIAECLHELKDLRQSFRIPSFTEHHEVRHFCLQNADLVFCTASSSAKLIVEESVPVQMVVIDEAAQLKECESCVPLQVSGLRHAVLIGDEKQLPPMVKSKICENAGFGRSLFERLVMLDYPKHLLKIQYRMHPSISSFPKKQFYDDMIMDGPNVKEESHNKRFLKGTLFGSYSFIDVPKGKEANNVKSSKQNIAEVFVIAEIVARLYQVSVNTKQKIRVGCISPYNGQVFAIQEKLGKRFSADVDSHFSVNVRSVDGFQGVEEDIIIISTVRSNESGSIGFLSNLQRANVALTRARHCLWILGSATTLIKSGTIWKEIVMDAKSRGCFHCVSEDENLNEAISDSALEFGQHNTLLRTDSTLFKMAKWKVNFDHKFLKSMSKLTNVEIKKDVLSVLKKLSMGWRHSRQETILTDMSSISYQLMEIYSINGILKLIWTTDILIENSKHIQVLKIWDILPSSEIPELAKHLDIMFGDYTTNIINRCKDKLVEGDLVLPKTWPAGVNGSGITTFTRDAGPSEHLANRLSLLDLDEASTSS